MNFVKGQKVDVDYNLMVGDGFEDRHSLREFVEFIFEDEVFGRDVDEVSWVSGFKHDNTKEVFLLPNKYLVPVNDSRCYHVYKKYIGFTDTFDYCEKCGVKS